jgi:hypothetical protein
VAAYEFAQVIGWHAPFPDIYVSAAIVLTLIGVFGYIVFATRDGAANGAAPDPGSIAQEG